MHAAIFIDHNFSVYQRYFNVVGAHPVNRGIELIDVTRKLYQQLANLIGGNMGTKNISRHVEVLGQPIGNRHVDGAFWKG